jgi:hypothetical protein
MSKTLFEQIVDEVFAEHRVRPEQPTTRAYKNIPVNIIDYERSSEFWFNLTGFAYSEIEEILSLELSDDGSELTLTVNSPGKDFMTTSIFGDPMVSLIHREFSAIPDVMSWDGLDKISRTVKIKDPQKYQLDKITSNLFGGVLIVNIPKVQAPPKQTIPRKIEITSF